jgi:hypothetical protein
MVKIMLLIHLLTGKVEKVDGLYTLHLDETTVEYACKGEVLAWIETGKFHYDDNLAEPGELE